MPTSGISPASADDRTHWQNCLHYIVDNWGCFEQGRTQPADRHATIEYRFLNARQVQFTAHEIKVEKLLDDVKRFLKSDPSTSRWRNAEVDNIGYRLVKKNQREYLGRQVTQWPVSLEPGDDHRLRSVTVTLPFQRPGAYLVEAKLSGGNTSFIVVWIDDTVILQKPVAARATISSPTP